MPALPRQQRLPWQGAEAELRAASSRISSMTASPMAFAACRLGTRCSPVEERKAVVAYIKSNGFRLDTPLHGWELKGGHALPEHLIGVVMLAFAAVSTTTPMACCGRSTTLVPRPGLPWRPSAWTSCARTRQRAGLGQRGRVAGPGDLLWPRCPASGGPRSSWSRWKVEGAREGMGLMIAWFTLLVV